MIDLPTRTALKIEGPYYIFPNYTLSLRNAIRNSRFDHVGRGFTKEHFPIQPHTNERKEVWLLSYDKEIRVNNVLNDIQRLGLQDVDLIQLLAFAELHYHGPQLFKRIMAFGSCWAPDNPLLGPDAYYCTYPLLWSDNVKRKLGLAQFEGFIFGELSPRYHFAVIRK